MAKAKSKAAAKTKTKAKTKTPPQSQSQTRSRNTKNTTRKNKSSVSSVSSVSSISSFQKQITIMFLEMLMMVKLFHWKTHSYSTHKATDELYDSLNGNMDKFIEVLLGKTGTRTDLMSNKSISLYDLDSQEKIKTKIDAFKSYLVNLNNNKVLTTTMSNSDLFNIRDEILGDLNKFLYLLTFK
jgi:DNA-binding ferritin-like protein